MASKDINDIIMDAFISFKIQLPQLALTVQDISFATENDPELKMLHSNILLDSKKHDRYHIHDGCILFDKRVWIPKILQKNILEYLHIEHVGAKKMIHLALLYNVYWPSLDEEIVELEINCLQCMEIQVAPKQDTMLSWAVPKKPWEKIHIDYAGPYMGTLFLLVIDEYSMWPEVFILSSTLAKDAIEKLKLLFSLHGVPKTVVSDHITSFMEEEFQTFLGSFGIEHCTCVPNNAQSYEEVVRFVFTLKSALIVLQSQVGSVQDKLNTLLFKCRISQTISTKASPVTLFVKQKLKKLKFDQNQLKPTAAGDKITEKALNKKHATTSQVFHHGQKVSVKMTKVNGFIINVDASKYVTLMVYGERKLYEKERLIPFPVIG